MKKLSIERREFLKRKIEKYIRITTKLVWRKLKRKKKKEASKRKKETKSPRITKKRTTIIKAPKSFGLGNEETRREIISMLESMKLVLLRNDSVKISFEDTEKLFPGATLFFMAQLEVLLNKFPTQITSNYPKDDTVEQLFQHIGALEKLGLAPRKKISAENVKHWHYLNGTSTDTTQFKGLFAAYAEEIKNDVQSGLYDSMTEAVDNAIEHAFDNSGAENKQEKRWWMFSQLVDGNITIVICDLGVGIPKTIWTKPELTDYFKSSFWQHKKKKDAGLIEIAVNSKRSRTKLKHRGKGLPEMLEFIKVNKMGNFLIHSYKGYFYYDAGLKKEVGKNFTTTIPGTLIQWEIPLKEV